MGQRRWPPIDQADFARLLRVIFGEPDYEKGDHEYFKGQVKGQLRFAQNDRGRDPVFQEIIKITAENCGLSREEFYGMLKGTAKKIGCAHLKNGLRDLAQS